MIKKIGLTLLCLTTFIASHAYSATQQHSFIAGATLEYELPSKDPQIFSNIFFWTIQASCTIISDENLNHLSVNLLGKKTAMINSRTMSEGDSIRLTVQNGEVIQITASPGAKVELVNLGEKTIKANCSAGH